MGRLLARRRDSRDLVAEVRGIDVMTRRRTGGTTVNDTAAVRGPHQGERGGRWVGAALGAARNVDNNAVAHGPECRLEDWSERRRKGARRYQPRGAGRSPRACGDATSWIAGMHHEAELPCRRGQTKHVRCGN